MAESYPADFVPMAELKLMISLFIALSHHTKLSLLCLPNMSYQRLSVLNSNYSKTLKKLHPGILYGTETIHMFYINIFKTSKLRHCQDSQNQYKMR